MRSAMRRGIAISSSLAKPAANDYIAAMTQYQTIAAGETVTRTGAIKLYGPEGFEGMRAAGKLAAQILDELGAHIRPGVTTEEIDRIVYDMTIAGGAVPATLNYRGYTHSCCISLNHVVCHGIPGAKVIKDGDIVNVDVTPLLDGWHGDSNRTYLAGDVPLKARKLVEVTYECLMLGIAAAKPGARLGDVGHAIQTHAEKHRYGVVRDFCGHGVGRLFHDAPEVVHLGRPGTGPELKPGMFFTIEPMINIGRPDVKVLDDGWTAVTRDRSLSAQFEHSIGITETGAEIFTKSLKGLDLPHKPGIEG
jgi:methionyl aminopeptidase